MTTNTSNLNLTKGTIPPLLKYKIVFLGDQAVGKSSIINRFIYDIFDGNEHVPVPLFRDLPLALISSRRIFFWRKKLYVCSSGTLLDNKDFDLSFPTIFEIPPWLSSSTMSSTALLLIICKNGSTM